MIRTLKHLSAIIVFGVVVAALGFFTAPRLLAQVKAALIRDLDNPARNAVQFSLYDYGALSNYHVPPGKTLVIEDVDFQTAYSSAGTFGIVTTMKSVSITHWFAPLGYSNSGIPTGGSWFGGRTTRLYADGGTDVFIQTNGSIGNGFCNFSGYLIDSSL